MNEQNPLSTRYWTLLKFAVPLFLALVTWRMGRQGDWHNMAKTLLLLSTAWVYAAVLWRAGPFSWCLILVENGTTAAIFLTMFIWLNGDMHGVWAMTLALPRDAEVWLAIIAALAGAVQFAILKYFLHRRHYFIPAQTPLANYWWLAASIQMLPMLASLLLPAGH